MHRARWSPSYSPDVVTSSPLSDLDRFRALLSKIPVPLDVSAFLLSGHCQGRTLDVEGELSKLDDLAERVPAKTLSGVVECLFGELGFAGDEVRYLAPENSYLDKVIERKRGIPISLAVLIIEVARRCSVQACGVGMPGHFLVGDPENPETFVDPFRGKVLTRAEAQGLFRRMHPSAEFNMQYLSMVSTQAILTRMLNNLRIIRMKSRSPKALLPILELTLCFGQPSVPEAKQLASTLEALGRTDEAARRMEEIAERSSPGEATELRALATRLWSQLN